MESISSVTDNIEQLWISIDKPNNGTKSCACIIQTPNSNLKNALENLASSAMSIQDNHKSDMVMMGDFNVDYKTRNTPVYKLLKIF